MGMKTRSVVLAARPQGDASPEDFAFTETDLPDPEPGQFAARVIWLSLDPYMRGRMDDAPSYAAPAGIGTVMPGGAVAEVVESNHPDFARGEIVVGPFGWTTHALSDGAGVGRVDPAAAPISTALGILGMPGHTAWVGLNEVARAREGETIVVSAATGAVGSVVGQLARQKGLRVIGVAGGAEKCAHAEADLGFDACLDHRAAPDRAALSAMIAAAAPGGVDVYFESVGGKTLAAVLPAMNVGGRIALCGVVAWFSGRGRDEALPLPVVWRTILTRRLTVRGFIIFDHADSLPEFHAEVAPMVRRGEMVWRETVAEGLDAAPRAFLAMLDGGNLGKQLVRVGPDPD